MNQMTKLRAQDYSEDERERITDYVCEQIAQKRPLYKVLAEDRESAALCSPRTFINWQVQYPEDVMLKVERAREVAATAYVEEMVEIADGKDPEPSADPQIRKLRVQTRKDAAAMIAPRRYGQRLDVTSGGEKLPAPAPAIAVQDNRIQTLIHIAAQRKVLGLDHEEEKARLLDD